MTWIIVTGLTKEIEGNSLGLNYYCMDYKAFVDYSFQRLINVARIIGRKYYGKVIIKIYKKNAEKRKKVTIGFFYM